MIIQGNDPAVEPSFTLRNRMARAAWSIVWTLLVLPSPRPFHRWRSFWYRAFGATIGADVHIYPSVRVWAPWNLTVGTRVGIGDGAIIYNIAPVRIGDNSVVSQRAHLCTGTHDVESSNFQLVASPISLMSHVWVCAESFVGPGVTIADGCVIGARAVVMKSVPVPWSVWAGNPAKQVRQRQAYR